MKNLQSVILSGHEIIDQYLVNKTPPFCIIRDKRLPKICHGETFIAILARLLDNESFHKVIEAHYPEPEAYPNYHLHHIDGLVEIGLRHGVWLDYCKQELKETWTIH